MMAEQLRQKNKLRSVVNEFLIPETGTPGDVYFAKAEGTCWIVTASGIVVSLSDILHSTLPHTPPRIGPKGDAGANGTPGRDGNHGKNGVDGSPGSAGASIVGPAGRDGRDGKDCVCKNVDADNRLSNIETRFSDLQNIIVRVAGQSDAASAAMLALLQSGTADAQRAVAELNAKQSSFATTRSVEEANAENGALKQQVRSLAVTVQGLIDYNKHAGEYVEWLRERAAQRSKK